jgi:hypothetical protein
MTYYGIATSDLSDGFNTIPAGACVTVTLVDSDPYCAPQYRVTDDCVTVWMRAERGLAVDAA